MKEGRALGVDLLRKNRLLFMFGLFSFSFFNVSVKYYLHHFYT